MEEEQATTPIDTDRFGANHQKQAQEIGADLEDPQKRVVSPRPVHDPFPATSSKRSAVKTYKDYAAESLSKGGGSLTKMIIAEREKKWEQQRRSVSNPRNVAMTLLSVIFIALGVGLVVGAFFLVRTIQEDSQGSEVLTPQALLIFDYRAETYLSDLARSRLLREVEKELANTTIEVGAIKYIYFTTDNQFGKKALMTTQEFLESLQAKVSGLFLRSLDPNFMYGVFSTDENAPFLIFKTENFSSTSAEMLAWEQSLGLDMGDLFQAGDYNYARSNFVDVVYYNKDARAILDVEGEPVIGYSFIDPRTLVIFSNRLALREIINRSQRNTVKE